VDNLNAVLMGFLALLLIIVVINVINAMFGNNQRKKIRNGGRDRNRGDMDRAMTYYGENGKIRQHRTGPRRNHAQAHHKQSASSVSHTHNHAQQTAHPAAASHSNSFSGGHSHH
jgi:hypothetical protein